MIPCAMSKTFRPWLIDQPQLLPASVQDFVPPEHVAHFVRDLVREQLDLSAIFDSYVELRGYPPFDPRMMTALLLYGYSRGVYSSRRLARGCEERVDFMAVTAMNRPDFRTISEFRRRHRTALSGLFVQVLRLCQEAGLVELGHVALDGTKLRANASKHKAMSYRRMKKTEGELAAEVDGWMKAADAADAQEDACTAATGVARRRPTGWPTRRSGLPRSAKPRRPWRPRPRRRPRRRPTQPKRYRGGRRPKREPGTPPDEAQRNFTDPESRIMKGRDGFVQAYNAQAAVDTKAQVILAHGLTAGMSDQDQLAALVDHIEGTLGAQAKGNVSGWRLSKRGEPEGSGRSRDRRLHRHRTRQTSRRQQSERSLGRSPRRCATSSGEPDGEADTGSESKSSSRCSGRSNRQEASGSSCCAASRT